MRASSGPLAVSPAPRDAAAVRRVTPFRRHFFHWLEMLYREPEVRKDSHCFRLLRDVEFPEGSAVDALTVLHWEGVGAGGLDLFVAGLWKFREEEIDRAAAEAMTGLMLAFRLWYAELLESAETNGLRRKHVCRVHGNLVGRGVAGRSPLLDLVSNSGSGELALWTWRRNGATGLAAPRAGAPGLAARWTRRLDALLGHPPWDGPEERAHGFRKIPGTRVRPRGGNDERR